MKSPAAPPLDEPRKFEIDEMFFSTTDRRGVIQLGNEIFVRVSGYSEAQLIGSAHNIIRHPDMPRAAFRLVWSRLLAGQPVVAYVKNCAADGRYYWVVALITPIAGGFLSIRFKPAASLHDVVQKAYADMRAAERALEGESDGGRRGMDAADEILAAALRAYGCADYETFMRVVLHQELRGRDEQLQREGRRIIPLWPTDALPAGPAGKNGRVPARGLRRRTPGHLAILPRRATRPVPSRFRGPKRPGFRLCPIASLPAR
ncbi:MAG: PAS domain-containing protein [Opitutus sp.]|nr:PAS domain-containing protein [Opitutus sp.]